MKPQRIQSTGSIPAIDLSNQPVPLLSPQSMADIQLHAPPEVSKLLRKLRWAWFFDLSCNIANQHRELGVTGAQGKVEDATILVNAQMELRAEAAAHAWVIALAQRAAMEIRQMDQIDNHRAMLPHGVDELAGVAFLAHSNNPRGTGRRLSYALQKLAMEVTRSLGADASIEFVHRRPVQLASPILERCAVPLAAYRIRYAGCTVEQVRAVVARIVQNQVLTQDVGDQLMLSQS